MMRITFSEQDLREINRLSGEHEDPRVRRRMQALLLKGLDVRHQKICRIVGISNTTLRKYLRMFLEGGLDALMEFNYLTPTSELEQHRNMLEDHFREHPPATIKQAMVEIEKLTKIKRCPSTVGRFLRSLGMSPQKVGAVPAKADAEEQEDFKNRKLEPLLNEAKEGKQVVFFGDAAHFVLGSFLGILWSFSRLYVKASPGRQLFNVLGALNAITHELIVTNNDTYISAESVCDLLREIARRKFEVPVTLVFDNARGD